MLIMLIMLIKKVAQSCRLGNKAEFVHKPIGNMNQSKNLTLFTISRFAGRQLDYKAQASHDMFLGWSMDDRFKYLMSNSNIVRHTAKACHLMLQRTEHKLFT